MKHDLQLYSGNGQTIAERGETLPPFERPDILDDPRLYLADTPLRSAVNLALALGQPLLVTGEPGTGKTQLAASVAHELNLPPPLVFNTKTTSNAKDLFYRYDALRHFQDAQFRKEGLAIDDYITYEVLGLAILLSLPTSQSDRFFPWALGARGPTRSVL